MAEDAAGQFVLHVLSAHDVKWESKVWHSKVPDLYVVIECRGITKRTQTIKNTLLPAWNEQLALSLLETSAVLHVRLHHKSHWLSDPCIGYLDITVADLLGKCANGEAQLSLSSSAGKRQRSIIQTGTIHLRLEATSAEGAAGIELEAAKQGAQRLTSSQLSKATVSSTNAILDDTVQMSNDDGLSQSLKDLVSKLDVIVECIDALSEIHPYLSVTWNIASALYKGVSNQIKVDAKLVELVRAMTDAFAFVQDTQSLPDRMKNLENSINDLLKQVTECCYFVRQYTRPSFIGRMLDLNASQKIDEFKDSFIQLRSALDSGINLHTAFISSRISDKVDAIYLQSRLNPVETNAFSRPQCLPGTRVGIRTQITDLMSTESEQNVIWLHGVAGSGKSTVSMTVAEYFRSISRLGAFLFFERGKSEPDAVIRTLAYKLASFDSSIAKHVIAAFEKDNDIAKASAIAQFRKLIFEPLTSAASAIEGPIFIVIDSLDECGTPESRRDLMRLLSQEFPKLPSSFRFLVTTRPEADIMHALSAAQNSIQEIELDYTSSASRSDVLAYLHHEMNNIIRSVPEVQIPRNWSWDSNMTLLSEIAGGLFICASTMVKLVSISDNPFRTLKDLILELQSRPSFGLNELYSSVLRSSGIKWDNDESRSRFSKVLSLLLFCKVPLSSGSIDCILGFPPDEPSQLIISKLRCLLSYTPGKPISLFHASFSDYLTSPDRAGEPWFIDIEAEKYNISSSCFTVMEDMLVFNICDIKSSFIRNADIPDLGARIKDRISPHLEYVYIYWAQHLCDVPFSSELSDRLSTFSHQHLLFWFEVLSLLKMFGRVASQALLNAAVWAQSNPDLTTFIKDAANLASTFVFPITESTPHIYVSMLPLMRQDSLVADHYSKQMALAVQITRIGTKAPPQCLKVFDGHTDYVLSVVFSHDGKRIISGSYDRIVRVSDVETGELVAGPFEARSSVFSIAISSNGKNIALGLGDSTLIVLDVESGETISGPFEGHTEAIRSVVFSPDGASIASGSDDKTVRLWGTESGKAICEPFGGHTDIVLSVAYSPDGTRLVSGSADRTVRVWDVEGRICILGPLKEHTDEVHSVTFSPDGNLVVSGSQDGTIRIWDLGCPDIICRIIEGHTDSVFCVACSPDGTRIVSGSADSTVRLWEIDSGKPICGPLEGHSSHINSVAFSPDGALIVSGSDDKTTMLWDANAADVDPGFLEGRNVNLHSLAVSPDGARIVTGCSDKTISVWDLDGKLVSDRFVGHTDPVRSVTFSPDGTLIVSGSWDKAIRIWAVNNGRCVLTLEGHTDDVNCVTFSPDGTRIASGSDDKTIRIWDVVKGEQAAGPFVRHEDVVLAVAFSGDGSRIVSGSKDRTVIVWNADYGDIILGPLEEHTDNVNSVIFSHDSEHIVSGSDDRSILVWGAENGDVLHRINEAHYSYILFVSFSPDGNYFVSGSGDETVSIWDVRSGDLVLGPFRGHAGGAWSVAFSPDGGYVIAGSWDHTIRVWDVREYLSSNLVEENEGNLITSMPNEDVSDWSLTANGWIEGKHGERLLWVPPDLRASLWYPQNTAVFGCAFSTKLDFKNAALGEHWRDCFRSV